MNDDEESFESRMNEYDVVSYYYTRVQQEVPPSWLTMKNPQIKNLLGVITFPKFSFLQNQYQIKKEFNLFSSKTNCPNSCISVLSYQPTNRTLSIFCQHIFCPFLTYFRCGLRRQRKLLTTSCKKPTERRSFSNCTYTPVPEEFFHPNRFLFWR